MYLILKKERNLNYFQRPGPGIEPRSREPQSLRMTITPPRQMHHKCYSGSHINLSFQYYDRNLSLASDILAGTTHVYLIIDICILDNILNKARVNREGRE